MLEAGLFVSNPKFRDRVFENSILAQAAGAVSCRHECLLEPKARGSDVRVLDLGPVSRHYKRVKRNRKAMNRNWRNQKANPDLKTKTGNK